MDERPQPGGGRPCGAGTEPRDERRDGWARESVLSVLFRGARFEVRGEHPASCVGRLVSSLSRAQRQGVQRSLLGIASHPTLGEVNVRVKALSGKRLANELVAALIANQLGVKVPSCFALEVDAALVHDHAWNGRAYCFASTVVPNSSNLSESALLANPLTVADFYATKDWQSIVLFDALVSNSDRTPANLLLGANGLLWAIDHDTVFGGDWNVIDLQPLRHSTNLLARSGAAHPTQRQRHDFLQQARSRPHVLLTGALISELPTIGLLASGEAEALSLYIAERWRSLDELLRLALFSRY